MLHRNEATPLPPHSSDYDFAMDSVISLGKRFKAFVTFWTILRVMEPTLCGKTNNPNIQKHFHIQTY